MSDLILLSHWSMSGATQLISAAHVFMMVDSWSSILLLRHTIHRWVPRTKPLNRKKEYRFDLWALDHWVPFNSKWHRYLENIYTPIFNQTEGGGPPVGFVGLCYSHWLVRYIYNKPNSRWTHVDQISYLDPTKSRDIQWNHHMNSYKSSYKSIEFHINHIINHIINHDII